MSVYLSPGVYPKETDFSAYVSAKSSSATALVGVFEKGHFGPQLCTSWPEFKQEFGGFLSGYQGAYLAKAYFDNGGKILWGNRIVHFDANGQPTSKAALYSCKDRETTPKNTIKIQAITHGIWGNAATGGLSCVVSDADGVTNGFDLEVKLNGVRREKFEDLVMDETSVDYFERKINGISKYIVVSNLDSASTAPKNLPAAGTFSLAGGDDGLAGLADTDYVGKQEYKTGLYALDAVEHLNLLIVADRSYAPTVAAGIVTYVDTQRNDCFAILDTPPNLSAATAAEYRKGTGTYTHPAFNSSFAAMYYPWLKITDPLTNMVKSISPVGAVAGKFAYNDQVGYVWTAPAGLTRGVIRNVVGVERSLSQGERDVLYPEGINPIASFTDGGIVIWGQKTLQLKASATDRVNIRRLLLHIEKATVSAVRQLAFQPNNIQTWNALVRLVGPFMQNIKDKGGLYDFYIQCDETLNTPEVIDTNTLLARIFIKPTKTAEFIGMEFVIAPSGAAFRELFGTAA